MNPLPKGFHYVPAELGRPASMVTREINGRKIWWWYPNSLVRHQFVMISAFHGIPLKNTREKMCIPPEQIVFGDSGGFQIYMKEYFGKYKNTTWNYTMEDIHNWQALNCDVALILDYPTEKRYRRPMPEGFDITPEVFDKFLDITRENVDEHLRYFNGEYQLYGVMHGATSMELADKWWSKFEDVNHNFDGWASGFKPVGDPMLHAFALSYLHSKGVRKVHILGISGWDVIPVMAYASKHFDTVTYDSSSWVVGAVYRRFLHPWIPYLNFGYKDSVRQIKTAPCTCPACEIVGRNCDAFRGDGSIPGFLLGAHNLYWFKFYTEVMSSLAEEPEVYRQYFQSRGKGRIIRALDFIDDYFALGLESAYRRYYYSQTDQVEKYW